MAPPHPLRPEPDGAVADWLLASLQAWTPATEVLPVASFVPDSFPAVARVLHPWSASGKGDAAGMPVTWGVVAGAPAGADMAALRALAGTRDGNDPPHAEGWQAPLMGLLDASTAAALVAVLAPATLTPDDVLVAVWTGWGASPVLRFPGAAVIATEARGHVLLRGPLTGVLHPVTPAPFLDLPAGIWWPADRAWVVATEVDFEWTFVAGSEALVDALAAHPGLEVLRTSVSAPANRLDQDRPI